MSSPPPASPKLDSLETENEGEICIFGYPQYLFKWYSHFAALFLPKELLHGPSEDRRRAKLFGNLTVGLLFSAVVLIVFLMHDGQAFTFECVSLCGSLIFYVAILAYLRLSHNLVWATYALIAYMNFAILYRSTASGLGLRSFTSDWLFIPSVFAFFMLGLQGGGIISAVSLLDILFLYFYGETGSVGVYYATSCVRIDEPNGHVFVPASCHTYNSPVLEANHISAGPAGLLASKLLALSFLSGLAYIYEQNRLLALKRVKEALLEKDRTNQSLRQATEAKTIFLANMSHELRTPMHGIIAMVKDLLEMPLSVGARESAKIVSDCAEHMMSLVDDILDFARIETNQLELECIPFNVVEEVEKAFNIHVILAQAKGVRIALERFQVAHPFHVGDPLRFRQILINLLSNAVKFTPPGGSVTISVVNESCDPELIHVRVEDTGIGIPAHCHKHMFASFSQVDASVGRKYGGSGLGLAISKKLCEAMDGDIWFESEVGRGTQFYFNVQLPVIAALPALEDDSDDDVVDVDRKHGPADVTSSSGSNKAEAEAEAANVLEGARVLVVEDNSVNQKVATKMLASFGCRVRVASDGAEGVDLFEKEAAAGGGFDAILMDVQMPVMDGFQATARIRDIERQRRRARGCGRGPEPTTRRPDAAGHGHGHGHVYDNGHGQDQANHRPPRQAPGGSGAAMLHRSDETEVVTPTAAAVSGGEANEAAQLRLRLRRPSLPLVVLAPRRTGVVTAAGAFVANQVEDDEDEEDEDGQVVDGSGSHRRRRRVPIIALTASATYDYQTQCLEKGMDRFLTKPLKKETLRRALEEVIRQSRPPSSSSSSSSSCSSSSCSPSSSLPKF